MSDNSWVTSLDGLPPIGVHCIVSPHNTQWGFGDCAEYKCKVIGYHNDYVWIELFVPGLPVSTRIDKVDFRPIKTERELAIDDMLKIAYTPEVINNRTIMGALYDAGYRKNES